MRQRAAQEISLWRVPANVNLGLSLALVRANTLSMIFESWHKNRVQRDWDRRRYGPHGKPMVDYASMFSSERRTTQLRWQTWSSQLQILRFSNKTENTLCPVSMFCDPNLHRDGPYCWTCRRHPARVFHAVIKYLVFVFLWRCVMTWVFEKCKSHFSSTSSTLAPEDLLI